jgi:FkbM family methyltransferase
MILKLPSNDDGHFHSIEINLITEGGWVLDAGCRGFCFSNRIAAVGCNVIALDPSRDICDPPNPKIKFYRMALYGTRGLQRFVTEPNPSTNHIAEHDPDSENSRQVWCTTIEWLMENHVVQIFDAVKLDIEGAEYSVLKNWPGPVAHQISVEWHAHYKDTLAQSMKESMEHVSKWYDLKKFNHDDTLLVLR